MTEEELRSKLAMTQLAKAEDAERLMLERDQARMERDGLLQELIKLCDIWSDLKTKMEAGEASDGNHTFNELYDFRMLYHASAVNWWINAGLPVVKSWNHHDGIACFGGGWFIVVAQLPAGQVSNHYAAEHWDLFHVPEVETPPEYDGHTAADVLERIEHAVRCWRNVGTD